MKQHTENFVKYTPNDLLENIKFKEAWIILAEKNNSHPSFFLSWSWMKSFLETCNHYNEKNTTYPQIEFYLLEFYSNNNPHPDFLSLFGYQKRKSPLLSLYEDHYFLNESGVSEVDRYIEYNQPLMLTSKREQLTNHFVEFIKRHKNAFFHFNGIVDTLFEKLPQNSMTDIEPIISPCYGVTLEALRDSKTDYLSSVGSNTKRHIKNSLSYYQNLKIECAQNKTDALEYLDKLSELHNIAWQNRGITGSFSNPFMIYFHKQLIENAFEQGNLIFAKIYSDQGILGYFYFFTHHKTLYYYQSGIVYLENTKIKPGYVSHYLLIDYFLKQNYTYYDFLAGDSQYKKNLGVKGEKLYWLTICQNSLRYKIKKKVKLLYRFIKGKDLNAATVP